MTPPSRRTVERIGALGRRTSAGRALLDWRLEPRQVVLKRRFGRRDRERLRELSQRTDLLLNIGSSTSEVEGWISCDIVRDAGGEILCFDASKNWPFAGQTAAGVNSEHFIEHLNLDGARAYLREAHRVLRPGGVIRTSTPDLAGLVGAYSDGDAAVLDLHRSHGYVARHHGDLVNNYFYSHGHRHIHDYPSLAALLSEAGFEQIERASFGNSRHAVLRGIDVHDAGPLNVLSLSVDAVKPSSRT